MISRSIFILCFFFLLLDMGGSCRAGHCSYGSVHACFKHLDEPWENATAHPLLHLGETFVIQVVVMTGVSLSVFFLKLHEFGTPVYEVLEGPSRIEQILEHRGTSPSQSFFYVWKMKVRTDTSWVNGYAPLEIYVQFNKNDDEFTSVHFDILNAFITDEPMHHAQEESVPGTSSSPTVENQNTPSNGLGEIILIITLLILSYRRLRQKGNNKR